MELRDARAALARTTLPPSPTPLADRLGMAAWALDLLAAALGSLAPNGLGCGLIAFAAHGRREDKPAVNEPHLKLRKQVVCESDHAAQFAVECLAPAAKSQVALVDLHAAYLKWCTSKNVEALPPTHIGAHLASLFDGTGITLAESGGRQIALGVRIVGPRDGLQLTQVKSQTAVSARRVVGGPKPKMAASG